MRTEDAIREALQREAATHRVNPSLPASTIAKARLARVAVAAVALASAGALVFGGAALVDATRDDATRPGPGPAGQAEPAERQVEGAPLLLVGHAGWDVTRVDQYGPFEGEMTFTNGERDMELTWRPADTHETYVEDREVGAGDAWDIEIARRHGVLFRYEGTTDFTAMWLDGDLSLELRGAFENVHAYRAIAETLDRVDEGTWLAALPESTVVPGEYAAVVDEMMSDVPDHPDSNVEQFRGSDEVRDRYQLGASVTGAVVCAWIGQWVEARSVGDDRAARRAVEAMEGSRDWKVLREMNVEGDWPEVVWEYADAMAGDGHVPAGDTATVEGTYLDTFGCPR